LKWAHYNCLSRDTPATSDAIINGIIAQQFMQGVHLKNADSNNGEGEEDDGSMNEKFDMEQIKAGSILYIYEEALRRKKTEEKDQSSMGGSSKTR
jgi:hypothetical protein